MKNVIVYSTSSCPYCVMVKNFLSEHKIDFKDYNVQEDKAKAKEMIEKSGQMGVPVIDVEGQIIIGFDKEKLMKALDLKE